MEFTIPWKLRELYNDIPSLWQTPLHRHCTYQSPVLEDEDLTRDIQLHLTEIAKNSYIRARDVVDYVPCDNPSSTKTGRIESRSL
jgi:hypothetical protein